MLVADDVAVRVVLVVPLMHSIAEQGADFVLRLVLRLERLALADGHFAESRTYSRSYFREASAVERLGLGAASVIGVAEFGGKGFAGDFVGTEVHIAMDTYLSGHGLDSRQRFYSCHSLGLVGLKT